MSSQISELFGLLLAPPSQDRDRKLVDAIRTSLAELPACWQLFGRPPERHSEYADVCSRVLAHLLQPSLTGDSALQLAVTHRMDIAPEARIASVLVKTLYQEFYKHKRETSPAFSRLREQLRYAVRRHGHPFGLTISQRTQSASECILRTSFQRRKQARSPIIDDLRSLITELDFRDRGRDKLHSLSRLLMAIESNPQLQPLIPMNALVSLLAEREETRNYQPFEQLVDPTALDVFTKQERNMIAERAQREVVHWLTSSYFSRIGADSYMQEIILAVFDRYVERWLSDQQQRTASKDILLELLPNLTKRDYESSSLRAHLHYICARFRRIFKDFQ